MLKQVRTLLKSVIGISIAAIFLSNDHSLYALIYLYPWMKVMLDYICKGAVDLPRACRKRQNTNMNRDFY